MPWEPIPYADNAPIIALIENAPHGIYPTIDSQCRAPNTSSKSLCSTLHTQHGKESAAIFGAPQLSRKESRTSEEHFLLRHFAGEVVYCCAEFLEKNDDSMAAAIEQVVLP